MKKLYVVGSVNYVGARRHSWQTPTQAQRVFEAVKAAGAAGISRADVVAKLAIADPVSDKNVSFYINRLMKGGHVVEKGAASAPVVSPMMKADEASMAALGALESALVAKLRESGVTDEARASFLRYKKILATAVAVPDASSSPAQVEAQRNQSRVALRMAILELVKLVY